MNGFGVRYGGGSGTKVIPHATTANTERTETTINPAFSVQRSAPVFLGLSLTIVTIRQHNSLEGSAYLRGML